jgi:citronellol/citronellal dehydrogenase
MKRYDLMQGINTRGTFLVSKTCIPHLKESDNAHILTLSPPLNLAPHWFKNHVAYTIAKYGMSMVTLGLSQELADEGIAANCLWPKTIIATAAVQNLLGGDQAMAQSRRPEIVADAAYEIFKKDARQATGNFYIDEEVLAEAGVTNFDKYGYGETGKLQLDIFLDE